MLPLLLLSAQAFARPPHFIANEPSDIALAQHVWSAGERCTGWSAPSHESVELDRSYVEGGWDGRAHVDSDGLYRVQIGRANPVRSLIHELAHAWVTKGPATLTEGRTDLLGDCMVAQMPHRYLPLDPDSGRDLVYLPDLRRWSNPRSRHGAVDLHEDRADAYLGAARMMRVIASVIDQRELWPKSGALRWKELERLLEEAGPKGAIILGVFDRGAEHQRQALTDRDRDGVAWLGEILHGTDPERWDSDGDGWWDGAIAPSTSAIPLPPDGTPVCSGLSAGYDGARVQVLYHSESRSPVPPKVHVVAGDVWIVDDPADGVQIDPNRPVLLAVDSSASATGGTWAMAGGQGLVTDWNCHSTPRYTVWVADPVAAAELKPFLRGVEEHLYRTHSLLGPPSKRLVVTLGSANIAVSAQGVQLPPGLVDWARRTGRHDALAALAVALHRTWLGPEDARRWDNAEALTRDLVDDPPDTLFVAIDQAQSAARQGDADKCPTGWRGVLAHTCQ